VIIIIIGVAAFSEVLSYYYPDESAPTNYIVTIQIPNGAATNRSVSFSPATVTMVLGINNTVEWINLDKTPNAVHTIIFTEVPANTNTTAASFSSSISPGIIYDTYYGPILLTSSGVYQYHDYYDPWMTGTLVVKP
jgi:plastocyanin